MTDARVAASLTSVTCEVAWMKVAAMSPMGPKVQKRCSFVLVSSSLLSMTHFDDPPPAGRTAASALEGERVACRDVSRNRRFH